jgi:hypothetical protein
MDHIALLNKQYVTDEFRSAEPACVRDEYRWPFISGAPDFSQPAVVTSALNSDKCISLLLLAIQELNDRVIALENIYHPHP